MTLYNLILVLNKNQNKVLFLYRSKDPYKGLYNLIGGKIEDNETFLESAYRELFEETGITRNDITLTPFIDYTWPTLGSKMKVFIGKLNRNVELVEEIHQLHWMDIHENFFDIKKFAGDGNIGHMINIYKRNKHLI